MCVRALVGLCSIIFFHPLKSLRPCYQLVFLPSFLSPLALNSCDCVVVSSCSWILVWTQLDCFSLRCYMPTHHIGCIDVTARNQLGHWAGVILCFYLEVFARWLFFFFFFFTLYFSPSCWISLIYCNVFFRISRRNDILPSFFLLLFLLSLSVLSDISKYISYLLFGTHRGHRNEGMPLWYLAPVLFALLHGFSVYLQLSVVQSSH